MAELSLLFSIASIWLCLHSDHLKTQLTYIVLGREGNSYVHSSRHITRHTKFIPIYTRVFKIKIDDNF